MLDMLLNEKIFPKQSLVSGENWNKGSVATTTAIWHLNYSADLPQSAVCLDLL